MGWRRGALAAAAIGLLGALIGGAAYAADGAPTSVTAGNAVVAAVVGIAAGGLTLWVRSRTRGRDEE
ncbi:hypothetical protein Afil01_16690 [Actinorhabdospora filicis]|uniref:LPXTG cell wall anchor domain-containing protein n=1 Tax=Actinorhabdospora filicis TaxID=1785913 RepID=A0A9W6SJB8_9ACTN|nr:hypothetical protein [Actinorhabdospora filicis]GLZ76862.1 hypothetical protein Afil01_16690 [Actinorhabdospora filicis]